MQFRALDGEAEVLWHGQSDLKNVDAIVIPGGFAHGDYLRCGAIAKFSPVMDSITSFAEDGGPVLGICNGFQVLTEVGLLPGALQKNAGMKFLCSMQQIEFASTSNVLGQQASVGDRLMIPINHFEGNYVCAPEVLTEMEAENRIVFRYTDNPNGSLADIADMQSSRQRSWHDASSRACYFPPPRFNRWDPVSSDHCWLPDPSVIKSIPWHP